MGYRYAVIGAGRQGTSAGYDIALFDDAEALIFADQSLAQAERAAERVNRLVGRDVALAQQVDVRDEEAVTQLLRDNGIEVFVSEVRRR